MELMGFPVVMGWTPLTAVGGFVILIATGRLIPKSQHDREVEFRDKLIADEKIESGVWRDAAIKALAAADKAAGAADRVIAGETAASRLVETLQDKFGTDTKEGGA